MKKFIVAVAVASLLAGCGIDNNTKFQRAKDNWLNGQEAAVLTVYANKHNLSLAGGKDLFLVTRNKRKSKHTDAYDIPDKGFFCDVPYFRQAFIEYYEDLTADNVRTLDAVHRKVTGDSIEASCSTEKASVVVENGETFETLDMAEFARLIKEAETCSVATNYISEKFASGKMLEAGDLKEVKRRINYCQQVDIMVLSKK